MVDNPEIPEELDWIGLSGKRAKGRRPSYFDDPSIDQVLSIVMALVGEVSVLRERNNTLERLIEKHGLLKRADIESYVPDKAAAEERGQATMEYIARVMRGQQQAVEAMRKPDPTINDVIDDLSQN